MSASLVLPTLVCAWCKTVIRMGLPKRSHGICPPCRLHHFPEGIEVAELRAELRPRIVNA